LGILEKDLQKIDSAFKKNETDNNTLSRIRI
jgi:hypothetical protein